MAQDAVPVYRSLDGDTLLPTSGIPSCHSTVRLLDVEGELLAITLDGCGSNDAYLYRWNVAEEEWELWAPWALETVSRWHLMIHSHAGALYAYGRAPADPSPGIYQSLDMGLSWGQIAEVADPDASCLDIHEGTMYIATWSDDSKNAYIYRLSLVAAAVDIKPGSCPNSFNRSSHGVLPVALVGTESFDVMEVDLATIQLSRADGVGGSVAPNEGPPGPHSEFEDVATPFEGELCDCHDLEGDGITDLLMKFRTDDVVAALLLNDLPAGDLVELVVSGALLDGTEFSASDCIRLVPPGHAAGVAGR